MYWASARVEHESPVIVVPTATAPRNRPVQHVVDGLTFFRWHDDVVVLGENNAIVLGHRNSRAPACRPRTPPRAPSCDVASRWRETRFLIHVGEPVRAELGEEKPRRMRRRTPRRSCCRGGADLHHRAPSAPTPCVGIHQRASNAASSLRRIRRGVMSASSPCSARSRNRSAPAPRTDQPAAGPEPARPATSRDVPAFVFMRPNHRNHRAHRPPPPSPHSRWRPKHRSAASNPPPARKRRQVFAFSAPDFT